MAIDYERLMFNLIVNISTSEGDEELADHISAAFSQAGIHIYFEDLCELRTKLEEKGYRGLYA